MFRSRAQQDASRANGSRSHGPVTPEGKARSARNATTHGLFSDSILLEPENRDAWHRMAADLVDRFQPADNVELSIVYDMAATAWRKERALNMEAALISIEYQVIDSTEPPALVPGDEIRRCAVAYAKAVGAEWALHQLTLQAVRLGNYWMRLHRKLKELQADRKAVAAEAAPASVPHPASPAPPEPVKTKSKIEPESAKPERAQADVRQTIVEITAFPRYDSAAPGPARQPDAPPSPGSEGNPPCTGK